MVSMDWHSIFITFLELAVLAGASFYAVFVLISYLTEGSRPRPQIDLRDPTRSAQHLAVWLGVKLLALVVRTVAPVLTMPSEASAEMGDWFLRGEA